MPFFWIQRNIKSVCLDLLDDSAADQSMVEDLVHEYSQFNG